MRVSLSLFTVLTLMTAPALAQFDLECDFWPIKTGGISIFCTPDGSGTAPTEAFSWDGNVGSPPTIVDATITMTLRYYGDPVYNYPQEDMWLESTQSGLVICPAGSIADKPTDENGQTTWSRPLKLGGATDPVAGERINAVINGNHCLSHGLDIQFNSPDLNGDLMVNLTDLVLFTQMFFGPYDYAADFYYDGWINLSDIVMLASAMGTTCP